MIGYVATAYIFATLVYIPSGKVSVVKGKCAREYPGAVTREGASKVSMLTAYHGQREREREWEMGGNQLSFNIHKMHVSPGPPSILFSSFPVSRSHSLM